MRKGQKKRKWTVEEKLEIIHKHLDDHISVRTLAKEYKTDSGMICRWMKEYLAEGEGRLAPDIEVATADQLLPLIQSKLGIGFVPKGFLEGASGVCKIRLKEPVPEQAVCLLKNNDTPLSIAAKALERMLLEQ